MSPGTEVWEDLGWALHDLDGPAYCPDDDYHGMTLADVMELHDTFDLRL